MNEQAAPPEVTSGKNNQRGHLRDKRLIALIAIFVGLIIIVAGWKLYSLYVNRPISIGDTRITSQEIKAYAAEVNHYATSRHENFGGTPTQVADNDLVLNAALKDQAKKHNVTLTQADIDTTLRSKYSAYGSKQAYQAALKTLGIANIMKIRDENTAYEAKLQNLLIANKQLLMVGIYYDAPYFGKFKDQTPLRAQATQVLQTKFLPLFQQHLSREAIGQQTTVDTLNPAASSTDQSQLFFTGMPTTDMYIPNYSASNTVFNDSSGPNTPGIKSASAAINSLTKVGQYTPVETFKAGFIGIIRLEGLTKGSYSSWNQLLQQYKSKYAKNLAFSQSAHQAFAQLPDKLTGKLTKPFATLWHGGELKLFPKAYATNFNDNSNCNIPASAGSYQSHYATFWIRSYDMTTGASLPPSGSASQIGGAQVTETRPQAFCINRNGLLIENGDPNIGNTSSSSNLVFEDNCWNSAPTWGQTAPSGYKWQPQDDQSDNIGIGSDGWPVWNNGNINQVGDVHLSLAYKPTGTGGGGQTPTPTPPPSNNTMTASCTEVYGDIFLGKPGTTKESDVNNALLGDAYQIVWQVSPTYAPVVASGTIGSYDSGGVARSYNYDNTSFPGAGVFGDGSSPQTIFIQVLDSSGNVVYIGPHPAVGTSAQNGYEAQENCADDQPTGGVSASCGGVSLSNLGDGNAPGEEVNYTVTISSEGSSEGASETIPGSALGSDYQSFDIYNIGGNPPGAVGFHVVLTVNDIAAANSGSTSAGNFVTSTDTGSCFTASCSLSVNATVPAPDGESGSPGDVLANTTFTVTATMNNTGPAYLYSNLGGNPLGFTNQTDNDFPMFSATSTMPDINTSLASASNSYASDEAFGSDVAAGASPTKTLTFTAPSFTDGKTFTVSAYPDYYGRFALGSPCTAQVKVYQHFTLTPGASSTSVPNDENPSSFNYTTSVASTAPVPVDIPSSDGSAVSSVYKTPVGTSSKLYIVSPSSDTGPFAANSTTTILNGSAPTIPPLIAGDKYYSEIDLGYTDAYIGPDGPDDILDPTGAVNFPKDFEVHNEPFVHFLSGDVSAGGGFNGSGNCSNQGGIYTYTNGFSNSGQSGIKTTGSNVQIGALSIGPVEGFSSAGLHADASGPYVAPVGFTFSNKVNTTGGSGSAPNEGGDFGSIHCITNYWGSMPTSGVTSSTNSTLDLSSYGAGVTTINDTPSGGTLNLSSGATGVADGASVAIYVTGNVNITGNIEDANTSWTSIGDIPSVYIIDQGGTIRINPSVTQLDGIYVAQPDSSNSGGFINTCSSTGVPTYSGNQLLVACNNQLEINGAFAAKQVYLDRTFGSLRDEAPTVIGAVAAIPAVSPTFGSPVGFCFTENDATKPCASTMACTSTNEPADSLWDDNELCVPGSSSTSLVWSYAGQPAVSSGWKCNKWNGVGSTTYPWDDNYLCSNDTQLYFSPSDQTTSTSTTKIQCTQMYDLSDSTYTGGGSGGDWLCENLQTSPGSPGIPGTPGSATPHVASPCSNAGTQVETNTCAAEVFNLSPEFYLNQPATERTTGPTTGKYDFITSLSPVL